MKKLLFSLCMVMFAVLPAQAQTVLVIGDSLSAGYGPASAGGVACTAG
jgi:lysophospholipase L1-like esterase